MKSLNKIISVLICMAMLLSCGLVQAQEAEAVQYNAKLLGVTNALGITGYTEADLASTVTRGEFYMLLCKTAGYPATESTEVVFGDLTPDNEYEPYAKTLYKLGIIAPDGSGKLYASNPITPTEAVSLTVRVLGYGPMAEAKGGYPGGYLQIAASEDISDGINLSGKELKKGEAVQLIYNSLEVDMMVPRYGADGKVIEHKVELGTNLLNTALGIEVQEGIVDGIDVSRITGLNDVYPFCVEINDVQIDVEYIADAHSYLGYHVRAYYTAGNNQLNKMLYIERTDDNEEIVVDIEDVTDVASTSLKAYTPDGKKQKTYKFKKAVPVVYNGVSTNQAFTKKLIDGKLGSVKLLDNSGDGVADVVFVSAYENFVVSHYDNDNKIIYHKYDSSKKISVDNTIDEPYVILYDESGAEITPGKIKGGNILTVFESAPDAYQKYIRAYLSTKRVTGTVDAIEDNDSIFIDSAEYELDDVNRKEYQKYIGVGANVTAYIDIYGKVADLMPDTSSAFEYGFITAYGTEGTLDAVTKFKIFTIDEEEHIIACAPNVRIDDVKYSYNDENLCENLYAATKAMYGKSVADDEIYTLVRFSTNSSGEITAIDTIMEDTDTVASRDGNHTDKNSLFMIYAKDRYEIIGSSVTLGPKIVLNTSTNVGRMNEDEEFEVVTAGQAFLSTATVEAYAFYTARNQIITDFMISTDAGSGLGVTGSKLSVVKRVSVSLDEDGEETYSLTIVTPSGEIKAPISEGLSVKGNASSSDPDLTATTIPAEKFKNGDVVRYALNQKGEIKTIDLLYRASTGTKHTSQSSVSGTDANYWAGSFTSDLHYKTGYVYEKFNEGFYLYFNDALTGNFEDDAELLESAKLDDCWFIYTGATSPTVYKYDKSEPEDLRISMTSVASLEDYAHTGSDASFVMVNLYHGTPQAIVEFK